MKIELVAKTFIVNPAGRLLVLRRHDNDEHRPGLWDLPGGQVAVGEDPAVAAIREAREETALTLTNLQSLHVASRIHSNCQVIKTVFTAYDYSGAITLSDEHSDFQWMSLEAFMDLAISEDYKAAARMLRKQHTSSVA